MRNFCYFLIILTVGIIARLLLVQNLPFDSDEAIIGLMSKHITGGEFPQFFYGNSFYEGILEASLASTSFLLFGVSRFTLHLVPILFSILFLISIFQLGREFLNREVGLLSMVIAAIPIYHVGLYSAAADGGYIEVLWLGNLILLLTHRLAVQEETLSFLHLFFLSLLWGIAWWTHPVSVFYIVTSFCFLAFIRKEWILKGKIVMTVPGFLMGSLPFWIWNVRYHFPFLTFSRSLESPSWFLKIKSFLPHLLYFFNDAYKKPLSFNAFALTILYLGSILFLIVKKKWLKKKFPSRYGPQLMLILFISFCFIDIGSRFGEQNAYRYILPLYSIFPISLALLCYALKTISKPIFIGMIAVILLLNICEQRSLITFLNKNSICYQKQLQVERALFDFLTKMNYHFIYATEYWSAAELTFNAKENPVFTLPFKDRYPLYTLLADATPTPAFVLEGKYRQSFEEMFKAIGGIYKKEIVALYQKTKGYVVYYDFKPPTTDYMEILPDHWKGESNFNSGFVANAFDRNISSSWTSSCPQKPGMFYQIDLGKVYQLNRIVFLSGQGKEWDFPKDYRLELSKNGQNWVEVASVNNNWAYLFWSGDRPFWKLRNGRMENYFNPQEAQFIKITITGPSPYAWTIGEIFVYQKSGPIKSNTFSAEELISFLSKEKSEYVYADIGLSAQITRATGGIIKCLQDDYDLSDEMDHSMRRYNGHYPFFNQLKRRVNFSWSSAFVVKRENNLAFARTIQELNVSYQVKVLGNYFIYYHFKARDESSSIDLKETSASYHWNGTHLLRMD